MGSHRIVTCIAVALAATPALAPLAGADAFELAAGKLPTPRQLTSAVWTGTTAYVFGGDHGVKRDAIVAFDPATQTAAAVGGLPSARAGTAAVFDGSRVWIFGGRDSGVLADVLVYAPGASGASLAARLPYPVERAAVAWDGARAYVAGGHDGAAPRADVLAFDPATKTTTTLAVALPSPRAGASAVWAGGALLVVGGEAAGVPTDEIVRVDPVAATAEVVARLPTGVHGAAAVTNGREIYVFGGRNGEPIDDVVRVELGSWRVTTMAASMASGRAYASAVWAGDQAWVFGGCCPPKKEILGYVISPGRPTAVAEAAGPGALRVSWTPPDPASYSSPITSYRVWGGDAEDAPHLLAEVAADVRAYEEGGLAPGLTRHYRVSAVNADGESPRSDPVNATTPSVPSAPQGVAAASPPRAGELEVTWASPADDGGSPITGYVVYRGLDDATPERAAEVAADARAWTDAGLPPGATRWYRVAALNAAGEGERSAAASATTRDTPGAPALAALAGPAAGEVTAEWTPAADDGGLPVEGWILRSGSAPDALDTVRELPADARRFTESGLPPDELRWFRVAAVNAAGEGDGSNDAYAATFTDEAEPPRMPSGRAHTSAAWDGAAAWVFGGVADDGASLGEVLRYDVARNELTSAAPLPSPRHGTSAAWAGQPHDHAASPAPFDLLEGSPGAGTCHNFCLTDTLFVIGGKRDGGGAAAAAGAPEEVGRQIVRYSASTGESRVLDVGLPTARAHTASVYDGENVYVFGGLDATGEAGTQTLRFRPDVEEVEVLPDALPGARWGAAAVWTGADAFVIGGEGAPDVGFQILRVDLATGAAEVRALLPQATAYASATWDGTHVTIFGGLADGAPTDAIVRFEPATGAVTSGGALPTARAATSAVAVADGGSFVFGGDAGGEALDEIVAYEPGAPGAVQAEPGPGRGEITVSWKPPAEDGGSPVTQYRVWRGTAPGDEVLHAVVDAPLTSFVDDGLADGATFYYKVSARTAVGESRQSPEVRATSFAAPSAPRNFDVALTLDGPALSWSPPASDGGARITAYEIWRGFDLGPMQPYTSVDGDTTSFTDTRCDVAELCRYAVRAVNVVGPGPFTEERAIPGTTLPEDDESPQG